MAKAIKKQYDDSVRLAESIRAEARRKAAATENKTAGGGLTGLNPGGGGQTNLVTAEPPKPGSIDIGSSSPNAFLYINGKVDGPLSARRSIEVPSGKVTITVKAQGCGDFDTTVVVAPGAATRVGNKRAKCN